jgi:putative RNA 2'-phosphotransferase
MSGQHRPGGGVGSEGGWHVKALRATRYGIRRRPGTSSAGESWRGHGSLMDTTAMEASLVRLSRFLSRVLRHDPARIGLHLDPSGWADVQELLERATEANVPLTGELLDAVVEQNDKQRFVFSEDRSRIRASQGHTIPVDLQLIAAPAPDVLYHGTGHQFVDAILAEGLTPQGRHHVHLSGDPVTATAVGRRHGRPIVLAIDARQMQADGQPLYRSANGVWLADAVAARYLSRARDLAQSAGGSRGGAGGPDPV